MYQRVSVIGVGITTVKQACQNLSLAAPFVFFGHELPLLNTHRDHVITLTLLISVLPSINLCLQLKLAATSLE